MDLGAILSGPLGAIFGAGSAIAQRVIDYKDHNAQRDHELALRDKDLEHLKVELSTKSEIAKVDADTQITLKEFDSTAAALAADKAAYGGGWRDDVRAMIRPACTSAAMVILFRVSWIAFGGEPLTPELRSEAVHEILFLCGNIIGYWFGARSNLGRRK